MANLKLILIMRNICTFILKLIGWKIVGKVPADKKIIFILAPHTSNWDLILGLLGRFATDVKVNFLAKDELFFFPLGPVLRFLGGTSVNRSLKGNRVDQAVVLFQQHDELKLAITPEGTRAPVARWKEGFYHMACQAGVCIVMLGLDYPSREIRVREPFWPSGNIKQDFPVIVNFYRSVSGRYPKEIPDYIPKQTGDIDKIE